MGCSFRMVSVGVNKPVAEMTGMAPCAECDMFFPACFCNCVRVPSACVFMKQDV